MYSPTSLSNEGTRGVFLRGGSKSSFWLSLECCWSHCLEPTSRLFHALARYSLTAASAITLWRHTRTQISADVESERGEEMCNLGLKIWISRPHKVNRFTPLAAIDELLMPTAGWGVVSFAPLSSCTFNNLLAALLLRTRRETFGVHPMRFYGGRREKERKVHALFTFLFFAQL